MHTPVKVQCRDQALQVMAPKLAAGGVNEIKMEFSFCPLWDGFGKTAVFFRDGVKPIKQLIESDDTCVVPWEVAQEHGAVYFGIFGSRDGVVRTTEVVTLRLLQGPPLEGAAPEEPTPSIYEQLLSELAIVGERAQAAEASAVAAAAAAEQAAESASEAADVAETARSTAETANTAAAEAKTAAETAQDAADAAMPKIGGDFTGAVHFTGGAGSVDIFSDNEGGNIIINSPTENGDRWQIDSHDGNLRFFHGDNSQEIDHSLTIDKDGVIHPTGGYSGGEFTGNVARNGHDPGNNWCLRDITINGSAWEQVTDNILGIVFLRK